MSDSSSKKVTDLYNALYSVELEEGWLEKLLEVEPDKLALIIGHIANCAKIDTLTFKRARSIIASFSDTKWKQTAEHFGLPDRPSQLRDCLVWTEMFETPAYYLPSYLHERVAEMAWRLQDVYGELHDQTEGTKLKDLEPVRFE